MSAVFGKTGHKKKYIEKDKGFGEILSDLREKNINQPIIGLLNLGSNFTGSYKKESSY